MVLGQALIPFIAILKVSSFLLPMSVTFPLREFYETDDEEFLEQQKNHLCVGISFSRSGCCFCEALCLRYKSCCVNYLWNQKNYTDIKAYKKMLAELSQTERNQVCLKTFQTVTKEGYKSAWNFMIDKCPLSNKVFDQNKILCEQNASSALLPVIGNDGYMYRNPYCSACNGIDLFEMIPVTVNCALGKSTCDIKVNLPETISMTCTPLKTTRCDEYHDLCNGFVGPYEGYKNYFCYLCSKEGRNKTILRSLPFSCRRVNAFKPLSWSTLLQFGNPVGNEKKCENKQIADMLGSCVNYMCPPGYTSKNSRCIKDTFSSNMTNLSFDECFFSRNLSIFVKNDNGNKYDIDKYFATNFRFRNPEFPFDKDLDIILILNDYLQNHLTIPKIDELRNMLLENSFVHIAVKRNISSPWYNHSFVYRHEISCLNKIVLDENTKYTPDCNAITKESIIPKWNLFMSMNITKSRIKRSVYACKTYYNGCPLQILHSNVSMQNNGTLIYQHGGIQRSYGIKKYTLINKNVYGVCVDAEKITLPSWYSTMQVAEGYISITGTLLSIISYIIVFVTFHLFEKPFNLPTHLVMALCTSLFCADSLFLAINLLHFFELDKIPLLCDIIGSINHFFLISGQLWCVIMAINLFISLKSINTLDSPSIRYRFIKYCLIVYVISLIMVLLAFALRKVKIFGEELRKRNACFFGGGFYIKMVLHALPLIVSFLISMIIILASLYHVGRERRRSKRVLGRLKNINMTKIAIRLILLFGIPEGIGLIHIPEANLLSNGFYVSIVCGFVYSTIKGLRGITFLLLYVCKKSVFDLYRTRFGFLKESHQRNRNEDLEIESTRESTSKSRSTSV